MTSGIKQRTLRGDERSMKITVPMKFVRELGLTPGNAVFLAREGNSLRVWFSTVEELSKAAMKEPVAA